MEVKITHGGPTVHLPPQTHGAGEARAGTEAAGINLEKAGLTHPRLARQPICPDHSLGVLAKMVSNGSKMIGVTASIGVAKKTGRRKSGVLGRTRSDRSMVMTGRIERNRRRKRRRRKKTEKVQQLRIGFMVIIGKRPGMRLAWFL